VQNRRAEVWVPFIKFCHSVVWERQQAPHAEQKLIVYLFLQIFDATLSELEDGPTCFNVSELKITTGENSSSILSRFLKCMLLSFSALVQ
jgi:hypothetical protein